MELGAWSSLDHHLLRLVPSSLASHKSFSEEGFATSFCCVTSDKLLDLSKCHVSRLYVGNSAWHLVGTWQMIVINDYSFCCPGELARSDGPRKPGLAFRFSPLLASNLVIFLLPSASFCFCCPSVFPVPTRWVLPAFLPPGQLSLLPSEPTAAWPTLAR